MSSGPNESRGFSKNGERAHVSSRNGKRCVCFVWKGKLPGNWRVSDPILAQGGEEMKEPKDWGEDRALCMVLDGRDRGLRQAMM